MVKEKFCVLLGVVNVSQVTNGELSMWTLSYDKGTKDRVPAARLEVRSGEEKVRCGDLWLEVVNGYLRAVFAQVKEAVVNGPDFGRVVRSPGAGW